MEGANNYDSAGIASCGHYETVSLATIHDTAGHNGNGRTPDSDCAIKIDTEGHFLGGPWRFAMYAPDSVATCIQASVGDQAVTAVHNLDECTPEDYDVSTSGADGTQWMLVGCFVSDQDGVSHLDPWSDGQRFTEESWEDCRQKAISEGSAMFVMEYGQGYTTAGHASCGHMNIISHGNYHVSSDSDAAHFLNTMGSNHPGDTGHNGWGRAPISDCSGELDDDGHPLGGPWRFAVYAPHDIAVCLNDFSPGETMPHGCWIGLNDQVGGGATGEDRFHWSDQSPVNFAKFANGEPNGGSNGERFVELDVRGLADGVSSSSQLNRQGQWNDQPAEGDGGLGKFPLCETAKPRKHPGRISDQTIGGAQQLQQEYFAVQQRMTWPDASNYCKSQGGELASIHSEEANNFIRAACQRSVTAMGGIQDGHDSCWIGANDRDTEGTEIWSDGTEIDYDDWHEGEPNNVVNRDVNGVEKDEDVTEFRLWCDSSEQCCATRSCAAWNDNRDDRLYTFICETRPPLVPPAGGGH